MSHQKNEGQYMTPDHIVPLILTQIGYTGEAILTQTIMEPSFGDGAFLVQIVQRLILEGTRASKTPSELSAVIQSTVYGIEKDERLYHAAIHRLNQLLADHHLDPIDWQQQLICGDTLHEFKALKGTFDYVVGNPPYVRIHHIPERNRETVNSFCFAEGTTDLYLLFYEIGLALLNDQGKLGYISPNSFLRNTSQKTFRRYLMDHHYLTAIYDFKASKLFTDADTYTCICLLNKNQARADFSVIYREYHMNTCLVETRLTPESFRFYFSDDAWHFSSEENLCFLTNNQQLPMTLQQVAHIQNGVATNKDAVYLLHVYRDKDLTVPYLGKHTDTNQLVYFQDKRGMRWGIESAILRRCVKASTYRGVMSSHYLLFPYDSVSSPGDWATRESEGKRSVCPIPEARMKEDFPNAYAYLTAWRDVLDARDMEKRLPWFCFGRSQGLQNSGYQKIVFQHLIKKGVTTIQPYVLDEDVLVYSGMYTVLNRSGMNVLYSKGKAAIHRSAEVSFNELEAGALQNLCAIFASPDFATYCSLVGKDLSGGYVSVSTRQVKRFGIDFDRV